jgi:uncharacterized protein YegP (UPF0339 family)
VAGTFELFTDMRSRIRFRLKAPDGTVLALSRGFIDKRAAAAGIMDVRECAGTGLIQDHTAQASARTGRAQQIRYRKGRKFAATGSLTSPKGLQARLHELILENQGIDDLLAGLADLAATTLARPGTTVSCGVILARPKKPVVIANSQTMGKSQDQLQTAIDEGPTLTALAQEVTVVLPDLENETRWPRYVQLTAGRGIGSVLAVPLGTKGESKSVLSVYSCDKDAFTSEYIAAAETFAARVSRTLRFAVDVADLKDTKNNLSAALAHRAVIDTALGVLMGQNRCSREEAFSILRKASNSRNVKLYSVAASVVSSVSAQRNYAPHFDS